MDHIPFYRILEIFKRQKIILAASTVNGWFSDTVDLRKPLYETLKKEVLSSDYVQIDESTIPVMDKDNPGSTKKGYYWIVRSPMQNQLFFHYQNGSRAQKVVVELLRSFQGQCRVTAMAHMISMKIRRAFCYLDVWRMPDASLSKP